MNQKKQSKTHHLKGYLYAVMASCLYAMISVLGKLILHQGTDPFVLILYQYVAATGALAVGIGLFNRKLFRVSRRELKVLAVQGIIGAFGTNVFFYLALKYLNAGITSMLLFTNPIFVTVFFAMTGIKKLRVVNYAALAMAMLGSVLVLDILKSGLGTMPAIGIALGMLSAVTYAFYNVYADMRLMAMNPYTISLYTNLYGILASGAAVLSLHGAVPAVDSTSLIYIGMIAVVAGILPVVFFYRSVAIIGSERTSIVATLELPFTLLIAFLVLSEKLNLFQMGGVLLMLGAAVLLHYGDTGEDNPLAAQKEEAGM